MKYLKYLAVATICVLAARNVSDMVHIDSLTIKLLMGLAFGLTCTSIKCED
jgi:hypothetical protein